MEVGPWIGLGGDGRSRRHTTVLAGGFQMLSGHRVVRPEKHSRTAGFTLPVVNASAGQSFRLCRKLADQLMEGSIMKRILGAYLLVIGGLSMVSAAQAEEKEGHGACRADVQKLCKEVQPGGGRIAACLKQHESEISPGCRKRMAEGRKEVKEFAEACKADVETLCKGVQSGQGRIMRCLSEHSDKLTDACRAKISEAQSRHPCMKDMERLCKDVPPGQGRMAECMKEHEAQLSPECKAQHAQRKGGGKK